MVLLHIVFVILTGVLGYHFGTGITLNDLWPYIEALRTTTSIIFGVMGALLAIVFPDVLKQSLRTTGTQAGEANLRRVLLPCANAAVLLIVLVLLAPFFAWVKALGLKDGTDGAQVVQQYFFAMFCVLTYWQIVILQMVLFPMETILYNTTETAARQRLRRGIHSNGRG
jgi:uncharacterized protein YacL